jgi:hypothetical protein
VVDIRKWLVEKNFRTTTRTRNLEIHNDAKFSRYNALPAWSGPTNGLFEVWLGPY